MSGNIYNHRHLQPTPVGPAGPSISMGPSLNPSRLNELLDIVRQEFNTARDEALAFKAERDEMDSQIMKQISEMDQMRASVYQLEAKHNQLRQQYEEDVTRLRAELGARRRGSGDAGAIERPSLVSSVSDHALPSVVPATTQEPASPSSLPNMGHGSNIFGGGMTNETTGPTLAAPIEGADGLGPPSRMTGAASTSPNPSHQVAVKVPGAAPTHSASAPPTDRNSQALGESESTPVPAQLKKEGSDWTTITNPKAKRILDVDLVHTLMHDSVVCCVRFSADGKYLATGCNRSAQIFDTKTGAKTCTLIDESTGSVDDLYIRSVCFSPDGKLLATGAEDKQVRIWDIARGSIRNLFQGHKQEIYSLDFSRDGRLIVSGSGDQTARVWDMETGQCLFVLTIEDIVQTENGPIDAGVTSVAISPDGRLVAAGSLDTMVRVWDTHTGVRVERLKGHKDSVYSVAFSPDGKHLVSGSLDKSLKMWDLSQTYNNLPPSQGPGATPAQVVPKLEANGSQGVAVCSSTFSGHKDYVLSVAVSPDGAWIVSGSKDRGVQFWDPATAQTQCMLQGHKNSVISVDLSSIGGLLATGSGDYMARVWEYREV